MAQLAMGIHSTFDQRLWALAERDPRRATALARRAQIDHTDPIAMARADYTLGWTLLCWERFEEARTHFQAAQLVFQTHGDALGELRCHHALLATAFVQQADPELETAFASLAERFADLGAQLDAARVRLDHARLMNVLGRPADAEAILVQIASLLDRSGPIDRARWLRVRGVSAYLRSNYDQARGLLMEAERHFVAQGYRLDAAKCWLELAVIAFLQEQLDLALVGYRRAEQAFTRLDLPLQKAFCAKNIGALLSMRGAYDLSLQATLTALTTFVHLQRQSDIGACYLHMGNVYVHTRRWEAALGAYQRAESCYAMVRSARYQLIAQRNQATVYLAQQQYESARSLLDAGARAALTLNIPHEQAEIGCLQARILAEQGYSQMALQRYEGAQQLFETLHNSAAVAECMLERGWLLLASDAIHAAEHLLIAALPALQQHPHHHWRVVYGLARCADSQGNSAAALTHYRAASATVAELRARLASESVSSALYLQAAQLHNDALACAARQEHAEMLLELSEGQRALVFQRMLTLRVPSLPADYQQEHDLLRERIRDVLANADEEDVGHGAALDAALEAYTDVLIRARHSVPSEPALATAMSETTSNLVSIRAQANRLYGSNWTALVYILQGERLLIVTVAPHIIEVTPTPYDHSLRRLVERASQPEYHAYTYRDLPYRSGQTMRPWVTLDDLGTRLIPSSMQTRLGADHRLLIVPVGTLHAVPWAAMRLHDSWLVERAVIQIVPSLATWQMLAARSHDTSKSALLLGCTDFGDRAAILLGVATELDHVRAVYAPDTAIQELPATRQSILDRSATGELASYRLIHIASHAQLVSARGLAAHVKLADGDLLLAEITTLRLNGLLVTLSACDGAAADALPGEEVFSLSRAFLAAGSRGVLASLWPVYDTAVLLFMHYFYRFFHQHGDAALALTMAQRTLIADYQNHRDPRAEPLCWGSFVFTGAST